MSVELTTRQTQVLEFINQFRDREQCNPTMREIADQFQWSSANAAHVHMLALQKKSVVTYRQTGRYLVNFAFREIGSPTSRAPARQGDDT